MVNVSAKIGDKRLTKQVGAAVAPEQIRPSMPCPDDFDAFWKAKIESLRAIPMNAQVERVDAEKGVDYFKVRMDNIRGTHIYGQIGQTQAAGQVPRDAGRAVGRRLRAESLVCRGTGERGLAYAQHHAARPAFRQAAGFYEQRPRPRSRTIRESAATTAKPVTSSG